MEANQFKTFFTRYDNVGRKKKKVEFSRGRIHL
jgi:hypothetical protein